MLGPLACGDCSWIKVEMWKIFSTPRPVERALERDPLVHEGEVDAVAHRLKSRVPEFAESLNEHGQ